MIRHIIRKTLLKNKGLLFAVFILFIMSTFIISTAINTFSELEINYNNFLTETNAEKFRLGLVPGYQEIDEEVREYRNELENKLEETFAIEKDKALQKFDEEYNKKMEVAKQDYQKEQEKVISQMEAEYNQKLDGVVLTPERKQQLDAEFQKKVDATKMQMDAEFAKKSELGKETAKAEVIAEFDKQLETTKEKALTDFDENMVVYEEEYTPKLVNDIEEKFDVKLEKKEMKAYKDDQDIVYKVNNYSSEDSINTFRIEEGRTPDNVGEVVITKLVSDKVGYQIGEKIIIKDNEYEIVGIVYMADYILPADITSGSLGFSPETYIPVYMNNTSFDNLDIKSQEYYAGTLNDVNADPVEVSEEIANNYKINIPAMDEYGAVQTNEDGNIIYEETNLFPYSIPWESNMAIGALNMEIEKDQQMMFLMSSVILAISVALTIILFVTI